VSKLKKEQGKKNSEKRLFGMYSCLMPKQTQQDFLKQWGAVKAKGFKNFYINSVWRWFAFILVQQVLCRLVVSRLLTQDDWIEIALFSVLFSAPFPLLLWKKRENEYEARTKKTQRQQGFRKWYF